MPHVIYKATFPSSFEAMMAALDEALSALTSAGCIPREKEACARLCLEEALVNAVRHGNKCDQSLMVALEVSRDGDRCRVRICDEGEGFQPDLIQLPDPDQPGGRGICLIRHFVDEIRFDKENKCFEMFFHWAAA